MGVQAENGKGEFDHVGFGRDHRTRLAQPAHNGCIGRGGARIGEKLRARARGLAAAARSSNPASSAAATSASSVPRGGSPIGSQPSHSSAPSAVFFGPLTYLGNAPNLMVREIAARRGVRMPGFFAYAGVMTVVLVPIYGLMSWVFF